jgi:hypothetical protein
MSIYDINANALDLYDIAKHSNTEMHLFKIYNQYYSHERADQNKCCALLSMLIGLSH